jgi:molybdenum cofactor cytidylyltransferase
VDIIVVEADGSRSLPFKAPGAHEPVVPEITTILVPIAGLDVLGQPLDDAHVHRPEIIASLAQQQPGSIVTGDTVARVLSHPQGGAKQLPAGARLVPVLNRADDETAVPRAREIAAKLLKSAVVDSVIISSMRGEPPVRETWAPAAGVILADGQSMGRGSTDHLLPPKHLSLAVGAARVALEAGLDPVVVVLEQQAEDTAQAFAGIPICTVVHTDFKAGGNSSVRMAIDSLPARTGAAVILAAGQPVAAAETVRDLVRAHRRSFAPACAFGFEGKFGNPVLFDRSLFRELRESDGKADWRPLLEKYRDSLVILG